jgi:hypothetical protein
MKHIIPQPAGLIFTVLIIILVTLLTPPDRLLGANLKLILLHGAWVWAGLVSFALAGASGAAGLAVRKEKWHNWSIAWGRTGLFYLLTYLPMSLLVMQVSWGGLYLDEPRWRIPMIFGMGGILMQVGLAMLNIKAIYSAGNLLFGLAFLISLYRAQNVLHPDSPITQSDPSSIQLLFGGMLALCLLAALQLAFGWYRRQTHGPSGNNTK